MSIMKKIFLPKSKEKIFFMYFSIISEKCVQCESCKDDCPTQAIENFSVNQKKCIKCGDCFEICPVGAVKKHENKNFVGE